MALHFIVHLLVLEFLVKPLGEQEPSGAGDGCKKAASLATPVNKGKLMIATPHPNTIGLYNNGLT